jgi:predicted RNA-binding Zn ribbon-like protein
VIVMAGPTGSRQIESPHRHATAPREIDDTPPAPHELELLRSFLSLHDHNPGDPQSLPPSLESIEWWLRANDLLADDAEAEVDDLGLVADVLEALRSRIGDADPAEHGRNDDAVLELLNDAARTAGLQARFDLGTLEPQIEGVSGAIGKVLALAFLSQLDGSWTNFKDCGSPTCRSVFYDRSKNHSGKWCSMQTCGNRAKVRAFRERQTASKP